MTPKTRFTLDWIDAVRPDAPLSLEKALLTYRWLCRSAEGYSSPCEFGCPVTPYKLLSASTGHLSWPEPLRTAEDLHRRLQWALLGWPGQKENAVHRWRAFHGLHVDKTRVIPGRHDGTGEEAFATLFQEPGAPPLPKELSVSLNCSHRGARDTDGIEIRAHRPLDKEGPWYLSVFLRITMDYSGWEYFITQERPGETIGDFAKRAVALIDAIGHDPEARFVDEDWTVNEGRGWAVYQDAGSCDCPKDSLHGLGCSWRQISKHKTRAEAEDAAMLANAAPRDDNEILCGLDPKDCADEQES